MFYSHELLTDRKYGVATVWLVATLGSKSSLRRINRRTIQRVDIEKACATVSEPRAPLALRLQSNLLYGISRVYFQQCEYVLVDAQHAQHSLRMLWKVIGSDELDPAAGKTKPENLVIQDDPGFMPDDIIPNPDLDLRMFESSMPPSSVPSILSGRTRDSSGSDVSVLGIEVPSSISGAGHGSVIPSVPGSATRDQPTALGFEEGEGFDPNVAFSFDEYGNLLDLDRPVPPEAATGNRPPSSLSKTSAQARQAFEDDLPAGQIWQCEDVEIVQLRDDYVQNLPEAEPFPTTQHRGEGQLVPTSARQRRAPRTLPMDRTIQLRNSELAAMNDNYLLNMEAAKQQKVNHRLPSQARKNATYLVLDRGLGNTGILHGGTLSGPLSSLSGADLWRSLTGQELNGPRKRRSSSARAEGDTRKRARTMEPEHWRGEEGILSDNGGLPLFDDSIEIGRDAPVLPMLEEHSSQMPWNHAPSSRGTSRAGSVLRSVAGQRQTSADRPPRASMARQAPSSPLQSRGRARDDSSVLGGPALIIQESDIEGRDDGKEFVPSDIETQDTAFERFGPAARVATQDANSQWLQAALEAETARFLEFACAHAKRLDAIAENIPFVPDDGGEAFMEGAMEGVKTVVAAATFDTLLPPSQHSHLVATQGFLHVLELANSGKVRVSQREGYGVIWIGVFEGDFAPEAEGDVGEGSVDEAMRGVEVGEGHGNG